MNSTQVPPLMTIGFMFCFAYPLEMAWPFSPIRFYLPVRVVLLPVSFPWLSPLSVIDDRAMDFMARFVQMKVFCSVKNQLLEHFRVANGEFLQLNDWRTRSKWNLTKNKQLFAHRSRTNAMCIGLSISGTNQMAEQTAQRSSMPMRIDWNLMRATVLWWTQSRNMSQIIERN